MIQAKLSVKPSSQQQVVNFTESSKPLSKSSNFPFVDLIRFVSMIGIVWAHTDFVAPPNVKFNEYLASLGHIEYYIIFKQVFKFGVLSFFMISGILLGDQLDKTSSLHYIKKRIDTTLKPYLFASGLFVVILAFRRYFLNREEISTMADILRLTYFDTMFWYLPNYLICLVVLLLFRGYLKSLYFGVLLFAVNIIYTLLTVYKYQVLTHTDLTTIFSYTFYLWLGSYIGRKEVLSKVKSANPIILFVITLLLLLLSSWESYWLLQKQMGYFNILRFGNQAYSLAMFFFLIRVCSQSPNFWKFNPRKESYGIYLYHGFFVSIIFPKVLNWMSNNLHINWYSTHIGVYLLATFLNFLAIYFLTIILVKVLLRFRLAYL